MGKKDVLLFGGGFDEAFGEDTIKKIIQCAKGTRARSKGKFRNPDNALKVGSEGILKDAAIFWQWHRGLH